MPTLNGTDFEDPRPLWRQFTKKQIRPGEDRVDLLLHLLTTREQVVFTSRTTTNKRISLTEHDGICNLDVEGATYARLTDGMISIDLVPYGKPGRFVLEGCYLDSPLFLPHMNIYCSVPVFQVETDGKEIGYCAFLCSDSVKRRLYEEVMKEYLPSVFDDGTVVLAGLNRPSRTGKLKSLT